MIKGLGKMKCLTTKRLITHFSNLKFVIIIISICSLFSCQIADKNDVNKIVIDDVKLEKIENQNKAITTAISLLEQGNLKNAQEYIQRVLRINPNHKTAKLIDKQLTKNISQIFSTRRYHQYTIKPSDSLGSIAETWLGNSIYFITLARSNNIDNPAKIKAGQILRIPVLQFSPLVKKEKRRSKANIKLINSTIKSGQFDRALNQMNKLFLLKSEHNKLASSQLSVLSALSDKAVTIPERKTTLQKLMLIKKETTRKILLPAYQHFKSRFEQDIYIDEFLLLFADKSYREAAKKLIKAKTIKGFDDNLKRIIPTETKLINKLHEEAIIFRKKQQLDDALTSWSLIILIDPNNELAIKYHERTLKLLERLKNL